MGCRPAIAPEQGPFGASYPLGKPSSATQLESFKIYHLDESADPPTAERYSELNRSYPS